MLLQLQSKSLFNNYKYRPKLKKILITIKYVSLYSEFTREFVELFFDCDLVEFYILFVVVCSIFGATKI